MNLLKWVGLLVVGALLVAIAIGCGGGDGEADSADTDGELVTSEPSGKYETGPLSFPARGPADYKIPNHREDIPVFGEEGSKAELEQAATYVHAYGVARLEENWPEACRYASESMVRRLAAEQGQPGASCKSVLAKVPDIVLGSEYERTEVEADSLRVDGTQGFLLYKGAAAPYFMPVREEDGVWKVDSKAPTPFYYAKES